MEVSCKLHVTATLSPGGGGNNRYLLNGRLDESQSRSGCLGADKNICFCRWPNPDRPACIPCHYNDWVIHGGKRYWEWRVKLANCLHPVLRLKTSGVPPLLPPYAFMLYIGQIYLYLYSLFKKSTLLSIGSLFVLRWKDAEANTDFGSTQKAAFSY
jgi:hypothetical protein